MDHMKVMWIYPFALTVLAHITTILTEASFSTNGTARTMEPMTSAVPILPDTAEIDIHPPPHPPTAVCGGSYSGWIGEPVAFDCSGSFDINEGDYITLCEWDLDNDGSNDCSGLPEAPCSNTWDTVYEGVVRLTVTDTTGLTDTCWTTVSIGKKRLLLQC